MLFWVAAACLMLVAVLAVLAPLTGGLRLFTTARGQDSEVYRDQLAELDRDAARGLIGPAEVAEARAEIARRLLRSDGAGDAGRSSSRSGRLVAFAAVAAVPLVAVGVYAATGSPGVEGQPLQARLSKNPAESTIEELIGRAEAHLSANPGDARGWDVLAPIYLRSGRFQDSVTAYRNAIRLDGSSAVREAGLGEAIAAAAGGVITSDAQAAFGRALALDPSEPRSRFFMALGMAQDGRSSEAAEAWTALAASLPAESQWRQAAERASAQALAAAAGPKGPTDDDVEAAAGMETGDRTAMIRSMVASLDRRLRETPGDAEGWKRLTRSYLVLGETENARDALRRGQDALGRETQASRDLADFATSIGLTATE